MRVFIALNIDAATRTALHASLGSLREHAWPLRWTAEPALHLTLRFLGDMAAADVARLRDAVHAIAARHGPQRMRIGGLGAFPSLRRANILWVGLDGGPPLLSFQHDIGLAMSRLGYGRDQKPFRPHITVARLRSGARAPDVERLAGSYTFRSEVAVTTVDIMQSHPGAAGARYHAVARVELGARAS